MDQKLFLEKLTEVADWEWTRLPGSSSNTAGRAAETELAYPETIKIHSIKAKDCPYQTAKKGCHFKITKRKYGRHTVLIQKCEDCGGLVTPKGKYIANPNNQQYPALVYKADLED